MSFQLSSDVWAWQVWGQGALALTQHTHTHLTGKKWRLGRFWMGGQDSQQVVTASKQVGAEVVSMEGRGIESAKGVQVPK